MNAITIELNELLGRIPRRHSIENLRDISDIMGKYEKLLMDIEAVNTYYEIHIAPFFSDLDDTRATLKKSADNKASKKNKDVFFDDASGKLKDSIQALLTMYADGIRTA